MLLHCNDQYLEPVILSADMKVHLIFVVIFCRRILKNRPGPQEPEPDQNNLPLKISASNKRENIHSINGAIRK